MSCPNCGVSTPGCFCPRCNTERDAIAAKYGVFISKWSPLARNLTQKKYELERKQDYDDNDFCKYTYPTFTHELERKHDNDDGDFYKYTYPTFTYGLERRNDNDDDGFYKFIYPTGTR